MVELTINQFEEMNLFSNRNAEKMTASIVNNSSNAALVAMFEDSVILLDHEEGQFYSADYKLDLKEMKLVFENFEAISLIKEETDFKAKVRDFLDSDDMETSEITESYLDSVVRQEKVVSEIINEAMMMKDFSEIKDYKELAEANNSIKISEKPYFKYYKNRLETNPLSEVKYFNFKDKVSVSITESESRQLVNSTAKEKAGDLWKRDSFKKMFTEASLELIKDVEIGRPLIKECFDTYPQIYSLDKADRKILFGKTVISTQVLRESLEDLLKGLDILFTETEFKESVTEYKNETLNEEEGNSEKIYELNEEEVRELVTELINVGKNIKSKKVLEEIKELGEKILAGTEEGTRPTLIKEAVMLLTI